MNDLIEALKNRLSSPVFGYFGLALLAFNWQGFFFLFVQDGDALTRIHFFEEHTNFQSLVILPLSFSLGFSVLYPWLFLVVTWMTAKPIELKDMVQASSEHKLLLQRKRLEEARSNLLVNAERELIERAKRDQELDKLESEELRGRLKSELELLRTERDAFRENSQSPAPKIQHKELMDIASDYRKRAEETKSYSDEAQFTDRARELEDQAHQILVKSGIITRKLD